ncbi:MAG: outer membrane beta-barrel protein [Bacteroidetes bacterium]|nr:outer membrane beta-barrel protein [Bacteroidota bacterium]
MQYLHRYKIIFTSIFFIYLTSNGQGLEHNAHYDLQRFHFGFSIVPNFGKAKVVLAPNFYSLDSVKTISTQGFAGFGFGGIADCRIAKYLTVRYLPQIQFSQRNFNYTIKDGIKNNVQTYREEIAKTETVALDQSLDFKFHSTRHKNNRLYLIGGIKYSFDFASNEDVVRGPSRPLVPFKKSSLYYEYGFGFEHFGAIALISTEIKMSNSITNMLSADPYIYTSSIDRIQARLFQISFHFQ